MVRWEAAFRRAQESNHPLTVGKKQADFTALHYVQPFTGIAMGTITGAQLQNFPAGAFILGISASAAFPRIVKAAQYWNDSAEEPLDFTFDRQPTATPGNMDLFSLDFSYTQNQQITPNGPAIASALLGTGAVSEFPSRELIIDPSQGILCRVGSLVSLKLIDGTSPPAGVLFPITVHVVYKCMVPRAAG